MMILTLLVIIIVVAGSVIVFSKMQKSNNQESSSNQNSNIQTNKGSTVNVSGEIPIDTGGYLDSSTNSATTTTNEQSNNNSTNSSNQNMNNNQNSNNNSNANNNSSKTISFPSADEIKEYNAKYVGALIKTNLGDIQVKFYNTDSPKTVANFLKLADSKFYNGVTFHRVIKGFMIQTGDPNSKDNDWSNDGTGGPGYTFADEFNSHKLVKGSLAMANSGPNTNGSQFFIVTAEATDWLDGKHTNFGEVVKGLDVLQKIEAVKVNQNDHPLEDVKIDKIELLTK